MPNSWSAFAVTGSLHVVIRNGAILKSQLSNRPRFKQLVTARKRGAGGLTRDTVYGTLDLGQEIVEEHYSGIGYPAFGQSIEASIIRGAGNDEQCSNDPVFGQVLVVDIVSEDMYADSSPAFGQSISGELSGTTTTRFASTGNDLALGANCEGDVPSQQNKPAFGHVVSYIATFARHWHQPVLLGNSGQGLVIRDGNLEQSAYLLQPGESQVAAQNEETCPVVDYAFNIQHSGSGDSFTLKAPEFGNTLSVDFGFFPGRARLNNVEGIFRSPDRPIIDTLTFSFPTCDPYLFIEFENMYTGQTLLITNHVGRTWEGILNLNPTEVLGPASYRISFTFVGRRVE